MGVFLCPSRNRKSEKIRCRDMENQVIFSSCKLADRGNFLQTRLFCPKTVSASSRTLTTRDRVGYDICPHVEALAYGAYSSVREVLAKKRRYSKKIRNIWLTYFQAHYIL